MKNQQILQWKLMEVLLPDLKNSFNKWKEGRKLLREAEETGRQIEHINSILDSKGTCSMAELHSILEKISDLQMKNTVLGERYDKLKSELSEENVFYEKLVHAFDGIEITKKQVTLEEFQAILYFTWVTGIDRKQLFECFDAMYPHITYAWDKEIANN